MHFMKNNVFSFSGKIIFFCFFSLAIFLTGCENFLTGSDFREKLETEVQYLGEVTCNRKNVMTGGLNGIEVISDAPTLVHTMYCSKNLGSDTSKDAITWVTKGIETGVKTSDVSFTYDKKNLESVPKGSYYTTVVHFADGTSIMTDVKQK